LGLAAIQCFERVNDLASLAPKSCFIAAKPIKGEVGKVSETQKAMGELYCGSVRFQRDATDPCGLFMIA
jgi:hypothetical protein